MRALICVEIMSTAKTDTNPKEHPCPHLDSNIPVTEDFPRHDSNGWSVQLCKLTVVTIFTGVPIVFIVHLNSD